MCALDVRSATRFRHPRGDAQQWTGAAMSIWTGPKGWAAIGLALASLLCAGTAGAAVTVPGTFQAENFDTGGEGIGYHDSTSGNQGDAPFRTGESVDIFRSNDAAGGTYIVKNFTAGEWLAY